MMKQLSVSKRSIFLLFALFLLLDLYVDAKCVPRNITHDISFSSGDGNKLKNSKEISQAEQTISSTSDEKSIDNDNKKKEEKSSADDEDEKKEKKSKHDEKSNDDDDDEKKEKKSKHDEKSNDDDDEKKEKKAKHDEKSDDDDDDKKEKKSKSEETGDDDDDDDKKEKKSKHDEKGDDDDDKKEKKSEGDDKENNKDDDDDKKEKAHDKEKCDDKNDEEKEKSSSSSTPMDPVLTQKVCGSTRFPKDCLSSITPFFTGDTDPESVLKMEVQAVRKGFTTAIAKVKQMKKGPEGKLNKGALDTCVENFNSGLTDLDSALEAITNHNINSLQTMLSSVLTYVTTCEDAMAEDPDSGELPNITNMEQKLTNLAANSLDIANQLNWT